MTMARKPKPIPPSPTVITRAIAVRGVTSPNPSVKNVVPLRYRSVRNVAGPPDTLRDDPAAQCSMANATTSAKAHVANSINSESGPK